MKLKLNRESTNVEEGSAECYNSWMGFRVSQPQSLSRYLGASDDSSVSARYGVTSDEQIHTSSFLAPFYTYRQGLRARYLRYLTVS